jgi:hypothetical protein
MLKAESQTPLGVQHVNPMMRGDSRRGLGGPQAGARKGDAFCSSARARCCIAGGVAGLVVIGVVVGGVLALSGQKGQTSGRGGGSESDTPMTVAVSASSVVVGMNRATFAASAAMQRVFKRGVALAADAGSEDSVSAQALPRARGPGVTQWTVMRMCVQVTIRSTRSGSGAAGRRLQTESPAVIVDYTISLTLASKESADTAASNLVSYIAADEAAFARSIVSSMKSVLASDPDLAQTAATQTGISKTLMTATRTTCLTRRRRRPRPLPLPRRRRVPPPATGA